MGVLAQDEIDGWLLKGGTIVTASERAARALTSRFHQARRLEGLTAWTAPTILDWTRFIRTAWEEQLLGGRLVLNPIQEQSLWAEILEMDGLQAGLLEGPRYRLAAMAMEAHELLCSYAPEFLRITARSGWQNDAEAFSRWLAAFDERCRAGEFISPARLPLEVLAYLRDKGSNASGRSALLVAGFDRLLPVQRSVFDIWGNWHEAHVAQPAGLIDFYQALDDQSELEACALWCSRKLAEDSAARILVVSQYLRTGRGQIERAFLSALESASSPAFEFSLGVSLSQVALPRAALLLLRWLTGSLAEHEVDWLFSTGYAAADPQETKALQASMRAVRRKYEQQPNWTLDAWLSRLAANRESDRALSAWAIRMNRLRERVNEFASRSRTALEWAELVPQWLEMMEFAATQPLSSAEFQASRRWQQALEMAGSLGFDGGRIFWREFLSMLGRAFDETVFAPESHDAPIQIMGPAESAALTVDAVWFLGATEDAWPAGGATHPLLPLEIQRQAAMPHATPQLDWDLAQSITTRLVASASEVHFSYARQNESVDARPSRLILQCAGNPVPVPAEFATFRHWPRTVLIEDFSRIPLQPGKVSGGTSILTYQSQCPFKAFAIARLGAENWEAAQAGLTPAQRGQLLHAVLHRVWAELRGGVPSLAALQGREDREQFTAKHVRQAFEAELKPALRDRMPARYLHLEQERLTRLIAAWLEYESKRVAFEVIDTEVKRTITLSGLSFDLRLDRIDRMKDGSLLVIDYKTGDLKPKVWELPRPEDIQLPLYASFAVEKDELLGGLVFAKVRPGALEFAGRVGDASATLLKTLSRSHALLKNPLSAEQLLAWRENIEQLARDFLEGRAEVDPRDPPATCERCGLQTLCRVHEGKLALEGEDELEGGSGFTVTADA